jgi:hypothetical protein
MRTLKARGLEDLDAIVARAKKAYAMKRISVIDFELLMDLAGRMEAHIVNMREINEYGKEEG